MSHKPSPRRFSRSLALLALASACGLLSACGTAPTSLMPVPSNTQPLTLKEDFIFPGTAHTHHWLARLMPGTYAPIGRDNFGMYFRGPTSCYAIRLTKGGPLLPASREAQMKRQVIYTECALFIPDAKNKPITIEVIFGTGGQRDDGQWPEAITAKAPTHTPSEDPKIDSANFTRGLSVADNPATLQKITTSPSPVGTAIGAGLGYGIVNAVVQESLGKLQEALVQPEDLKALKQAFGLNETKP